MVKIKLIMPKKFETNKRTNVITPAIAKNL